MTKGSSEKINPLLVDILVELTQIRLALTTDLSDFDIAHVTAKIFFNKKYLSNIQKHIEVREEDF